MGAQGKRQRGNDDSRGSVKGPATENRELTGYCNSSANDASNPTFCKDLSGFATGCIHAPQKLRALLSEDLGSCISSATCVNFARPVGRNQQAPKFATRLPHQVRATPPKTLVPPPSQGAENTLPSRPIKSRQKQLLTTPSPANGCHHLIAQGRFVNPVSKKSGASKLFRPPSKLVWAIPSRSTWRT